jgi:hypothetical protein
MSRAGVLTFQNRIGTTLSAPVAEFHDDGTNFPYDGVGISFEADAVVNRAVVTGLDGKTVYRDRCRVYCHIFYSDHKHHKQPAT